MAGPAKGNKTPSAPFRVYDNLVWDLVEVFERSDTFGVYDNRQRAMLPGCAARQFCLLMGLFQSSRFSPLGSRCSLLIGIAQVGMGSETRPGWDGPKRRQGFGAESFCLNVCKGCL